MNDLCTPASTSSEFHRPSETQLEAEERGRVIMEKAMTRLNLDDPITNTSEAYHTLPSITNHLGIEPVFQVLPVCPECMEVYLASTTHDQACIRCHSSIFKFTQSRDSCSAAAGSEKSRAWLQFPMKSIEAQLHDIIAVQGMEDILEAWRGKPRQPGEYIDNFDGAICQELKGQDGWLFFENPRLTDDTELQIGLTLSMDWFSYLRSLIVPSHSSGPMSFNIINLPDWLWYVPVAHIVILLMPWYRYRTSNLLLSGITPGPKEQTSDQIQCFMWVFVNELIHLYEDGFVVPTEKYPEGRDIGVICDKPAAHKLGGFGSHSHTNFCHHCWISLSEKQTAAAFQSDACKPRSHEEQFTLMKEYLALLNETQWKTFVSTYATRWCELARLPYFDVCRMIVIDPMHNLLLGLVKTHFYNIWIQLNVLHKNKELRHFHDILVQLNIPAYLGRLPAMMGEPAGGSLTADQWLIAATIVCPIIIPQIWSKYCPDPVEADIVLACQIDNLAQEIEDQKAAARKAAAEARKAKDLYISAPEPEDADDIPDAGAIEDASDDEYEGDQAQKCIRLGEKGQDLLSDSILPNIHPRDPANFFKLSTALRLILVQKTRDKDIEEADRLLRDYGLELIQLYSTSVIKPNHHYATHTASCMCDYGPLHCFWTFLFERINKVPKSYNSGNHSGGELEVSFFQEFHRTVQQSCVMMQDSYNAGVKMPIHESIASMYKATADNCGTVQALVQESDEVYKDGDIALQMSPHSRSIKLPIDVYDSLLRHLQARFPALHLRSYFALGDATSLPLDPRAIIFDYAIVAQRHYWSLSHANSNANSLVAICTGSQHNDIRIGELLDIITLQQKELGVQSLGHVRWLKPANISLDHTFWSTR
ncbi:uncharacterized protein EV420DRAFT_1616565 [Desarmillaria tabescens]|uniref:Transposase domain-containing protein n=1 Tax=Armillaria tabescens TaxID=1929756 RepID=A0AA39NRM7_ARMTA|nr:uncharacterized protein EV420DRAFT_1616565 [Desarmillaria tabescens]KAK0470420.1 hypothetical protein EV420DRAFT_1616565 [Desarmillaria tabescens]